MRFVARSAALLFEMACVAWMPASQADLVRAHERDRVPYDLWIRQGFIEATEGNVVDYGDSGSSGDPDEAAQRLVEFHNHWQPRRPQPSGRE
jgi:hypothetical protein